MIFDQQEYGLSRTIATSIGIERAEQNRTPLKDSEELSHDE